MKRQIAGLSCICMAVILAGITVRMYGPRLADYKESRDLYDQIETEYTAPPRIVSADAALPEMEGNGITDQGNGIADQGYQASQSNEYGQLGTPGAQSAMQVRAPIDGGSVQVDGLAELMKSTYPNLDPDDFRCIEVDGDGLLNENPDYLGWIYIPGTQISYPVCTSENHEEYIHTNFYGGYNYAGTIFADYLCTKGVLNHHLILYGHNMRDGSMFAGIRSYLDQEFADTHPVMWFITPEYQFLYQVFSVCVPSPYDRVQYGIDGIDFEDNLDFDDAIKEMITSSSCTFPATAGGMDYILSLSTCVGDDTKRCIVHSKLVGALPVPLSLELESEGNVELS